MNLPNLQNLETHTHRIVYNLITRMQKYLFLGLDHGFPIFNQLKLKALILNSIL